MKSKKSQASGITWFVAFVIIFFIMITYAIASMAVAAKRYIDVGKSGGVGSDFQESNLIFLKQFQSFLKSEVDANGKKYSIKQVFSAWADDSEEIENADEVLKSNVKPFIEKFDYECYIFQARSKEPEGSGEKLIDLDNLVSRDSYNFKGYYLEIYLVSSEGNLIKISVSRGVKTGGIC